MIILIGLILMNYIKIYRMIRKTTEIYNGENKKKNKKKFMIEFIFKYKKNILKINK